MTQTIEYTIIESQTTITFLFFLFLYKISHILGGKFGTLTKLALHYSPADGTGHWRRYHSNHRCICVRGDRSS